MAETIASPEMQSAAYRALFAALNKEMDRLGISAKYRLNEDALTSDFTAMLALIIIKQGEQLEAIRATGPVA